MTPSERRKHERTVRNLAHKIRSLSRELRAAKSRGLNEAHAVRKGAEPMIEGMRAETERVRALYAEHQGDDFEIVGIHSPEFDYEKEPEAIAAAADEFGVTWPIALDTRKRTFFGWQGGPAYWPRTYVLDREGHIRFDHIGEGAYEELNEAVAYLLG